MDDARASCNGLGRKTSCTARKVFEFSTSRRVLVAACSTCCRLDPALHGHPQDLVHEPHGIHNAGVADCDDVIDVGGVATSYATAPKKK